MCCSASASQAYTNREGAADGKQALHRSNAKFAASKRDAALQAQTERLESEYQEKLETREAHLRGLKDRYVDPDTSAVVESSAYEIVSNAHRGEGSQAGSQVSAEGGSAGGRGPWSPSAKSSGWFAEWWAGPEIKATALA